MSERAGRWMKHLLAGTTLLVAAGCATPYYTPAVEAPPAKAYRRQIKPVVAVTDFDNKSGFSGSWNLGSGMTDILVNELIDTERVIVLERRHLANVISEINQQDSDLFRAEGRVPRGRLKVARYLIRGAVTDFTVTRDTSGWFSAEDKGSIFGRGQKASVMLHAVVIDVEDGEVIGSTRAVGKAGSTLFGGSFEYKKIQFGGETFFRTPLGRATEEAMEEAVDRLLDIIPREYWRPMIAHVNGKEITLNGGENVGIKPGAQFYVMLEDQTITDPLTGEPIERRKGRPKGLLTVTEVLEATARATLTNGDAERGDLLEPILAEK